MIVKINVLSSPMQRPSLCAVFWNRLTSKFGTTFYVRDNGIDLAITNAVESIVTCLRSEDEYCVQVPDATPSLKSLGLS